MSKLNSSTRWYLGIATLVIGFCVFCLTLLGRPIRGTFDADEQVHEVVFTPDGRFLLTGGGIQKSPSSGAPIGLLRIWDVATGKLLTTLNLSQMVYSLRFSPDRKTLAIGMVTGVELWDWPSRKTKRLLSDVASDAKYSPDGKYFASGGPGGYSVYRWDALTGKSLPDWTESPSTLSDVAYSPDGKTIIGCGDYNFEPRGQVTWWNTSTGKIVRILRVKSRLVPSVAISPNGATAIWTLDYGTHSKVEVWDTRQKRSVRTFDLFDMKGDVLTGTLLFAPNGQWFAAYGGDNIYLHSPRGERRLRTLLPPKTAGGIRHVAISPDSRFIAGISSIQTITETTIGEAQGIIQLWDAKTGKSIRQFQFPVPRHSR